MSDLYGMKRIYPTNAARVIQSDDSEPANPWLVIGACLVAFALGVGLVFAFAWLATRLAFGPFAVAFLIALIARRTFR